MKVVTAEAMQQMDRQAIEELGVAGLTLMENAGRACVEAIMAEFEGVPSRKAVVIAGKGNNGGDGFVVARLLREVGWQAVVFVLSSRDEITGDARTNLERLGSTSVTFCREPGVLGHYVAVLREADVIVDALLGTGIGSPVKGSYAEAVGLINNAGRPVVAVDIPSGIEASTGRVLGTAVRASITVTFGLAKYGHVLFPGAEHAGRLVVADIGIPQEIMAAASGAEFVDAALAATYLHSRNRCAYKASFGHCLIVAGATGKSGAAAMAANSAVRGGAGLVTLAAPASLNQILEIKTTEAMTLPLYDGDRGFLGEEALPAIKAALAGKNAMALGPGLGPDAETRRLVRVLLTELNLPLVVDADALNALSEEPETLLRKKTTRLVLTPHPGEMARLAGLSVATIESDRMGVARKFAETYQVYVVLKGARTIIAAPSGDIAINGSGNPGMASGGMGDVLTGVLVALLAQGYDVFQACKLGVFIHGLAADMVAADKGEMGMAAVDVQERLPYAFKKLMVKGLPVV